MSRLTLPHYGGNGHYMKCSEQFGCSGECTDCEELDKIVEKLAEYEDKEEQKPKTNADRIRAMSDEELSTLLCDISDCSVCRFGQYSGCALREWLKQPAETHTENADRCV